ncbi:hypothetical protein M0813_29115 [Anaeramoeba flamelloides]|uniref:Uncharacterized protein n=1 Tax=Anaeramoeba flamelloides TaxID=1746091 RepID=A0ABQ8XQA0_9EUKA|nr:hypothetical protein M0813_29115 [Anaeramoeba flamelloides]
MNTRTKKSRTKTKNQERLELLLKNYPKSTTGLNLMTLKLINTPKKVLISKKAIDNSVEPKLTLQDLILFMIKKFNLFFDSETQETDDKFYVFHFYKAQKIDHLLAKSETNEFSQKIPLITKSLLFLLQNSSDLIQGLEAKHLGFGYNVPRQVSIEKDSLRRLCKDQNYKDPKNQVKKIFRALAFFFQARYNLVNKTNKNRIYLIFGRNYVENSGDDNSTKWGFLDLDLDQNKNFKSKNATSNHNCNHLNSRSSFTSNSDFIKNNSKENIDPNHANERKRMISPNQKNQSTNPKRSKAKKRDKKRNTITKQIIVTKQRETRQTLIQPELMYHSTSPIPNNGCLLANNSSTIHSSSSQPTLPSCSSSLRSSRPKLSIASNDYEETLKLKSESELEGELVSLLLSLSERKF